MKKIDSKIIKKILELTARGISQRKIADILKISKSSVQKYAANNNISIEKKAVGRPKKISGRTERLIYRGFVQKAIRTTAEAKEKIMGIEKKSLSCQSIRNILRQNSIINYKKYVKPRLTILNIKNRYNFAKEFGKYNFQDWGKVLFSDESKYNIQGSDGMKHFWAKKGIKYNSREFIERTKFGGGSVMVWGIIGFDGVGKIIRTDHRINSRKYVEILKNGLLDTYLMLNYKISDTIFMQDNAPCHTSRTTMDWLKAQNIKCFKWPANSPDMNPIENVWDYIEKRLREHKIVYDNSDELFNKIEKIWYSIPKSYIKNLYKSLPQRIFALKLAKGEKTKY